MNDFGAPGPTEILQYAIDAVNDVGESTLTPEKWEKFVHYMSLMGAALDRGDLAEIQRCRQVIEALQSLHNKTEELPEVQKTRQSEWIREHSERLTERLEQAKAGKTPPAADPRR
ncbi:CATRA system-associated protein [Micromonospora arborensis]|nr:CATRA system-associated protein [Micromonospora arborensis]